MPFWRCNIERTADDKLHQEVWSFFQLSSDPKIVLDLYAKLEHATTRRKFKPVPGFTYARYNKRENRLDASNVPWPADVVAEAKQRFVDSIEIVKEK